MKHGSFKAVCLIFMVYVAAISVFGDENTVNIEARMLDSFDGDSNYIWKAVASKFATVIDDESFPKVNYVATWPSAVKQSAEEPKSLGIWGRFDRQGYNWVDIYPVAGEDDTEPVAIPIPGRAQSLDLWVWGSNLNYTLEAYVRDYQGVVHTINLGNLRFTGWKNLRAAIPASIPQSKRVLPRLAGLELVKFRVWTQPTEQVANFYIYFDQLKVLTDTFETVYDGEELANPERIQELWASGSGNNQGGL